MCGVKTFMLLTLVNFLKAESNVKFYQAGYEYSYEYDSQIASSTSNGKEYSASRFSALVKLNFLTDSDVMVQLENCRLAELNKYLENPETLSEFKSFEIVQIKSDHLEKFYLPFKMKFNKGKITNIIFHQDDLLFSENIKKSIVNTLQVQLEGHDEGCNETSQAEMTEETNHNSQAFAPNLTIINGTVVTPEDYENTIIYFTFYVPSSQGRSVCTGEVGSHNFFITNCHCVMNRNSLEQYTDFWLYDDPQLSGWTPTCHPNTEVDLAKLSNLNYVFPHAMKFIAIDVSHAVDEALILGYGMGKKGNNKRDLKQASVRMKKASECRYDDEEYCTATDEASAQKGDSGGALLICDNSEYFQIGVIKQGSSSNDYHVRSVEVCDWLKLEINCIYNPNFLKRTASLIENAPTQIIVEDVDATHHVEEDKGHHDEIKVDVSHTNDEQEPLSPPQLASQEHSPQQKSDDEEVTLERTKRSIEEYPKEPSPPIEKEDSPASADIHVEKTEAVAPLNVERESSPPSLVELSRAEVDKNSVTESSHKESTPPPVPKITTKPPTPPSSPVEDKAEEDVIIPKIVAPETKEETTVTTTKTTESYHVKPIDLTPLPEDEPIPVGIPEVRTTETVKEEKEKAKKDKKGSSSSEDDKDKTGTRRQEGGIVGAVRRRCTIL